MYAIYMGVHETLDENRFQEMCMEVKS